MTQGKKKLISIVVSLVSMFLCGFTVLYLWNWFIASTFRIAVLTFPQALGLDILVSFLVYLSPVKQMTDMEGEEFKKYVIWSIGTPIDFFILGYIVHLFL